MKEIRVGENYENCIPLHPKCGIFFELFENCIDPNQKTKSFPLSLYGSCVIAHSIANSYWILSWSKSRVEN